MGCRVLLQPHRLLRLCLQGDADHQRLEGAGQPGDGTEEGREAGGRGVMERGREGGRERRIEASVCLPSQVGDNQCLLQSLKDSPYFSGFADKAALWEGRLADLDEYLHHLNQIQRKWVYLEPIFGRGALPREQARFRRVDSDFRWGGSCRA